MAGVNRGGSNWWTPPGLSTTTGSLDKLRDAAMAHDKKK